MNLRVRGSGCKKEETQLATFGGYLDPFVTNFGTPFEKHEKESWNWKEIKGARNFRMVQ